MIFSRYVSYGLRTLVLLAAVALPSQFCPAQDKKDSEGWVDLLQGDDLNKNWTTAGNWKLDKDGVAHLDPRAGESGWTRWGSYLWSKKQYGDFEIEFDYKLAKQGNSGFYFRVGDMNDPVAKGIEVQIYDSPSKKPGTKLNDHDSGGIIPGLPPTKSTAKAAGEWNHFQISSLDNKLVVRLNGDVVNEVDLAKAPLSTRPEMGNIGFQDHGLPIWIRNLRIREVK